MNGFKGRSLVVISDFNLDERGYLFEKTRELKKTIAEGGDITPFQIDDKDPGIYEVFLEASTRTRESFRNAARFHGVIPGEIEASSSSLNKKESFADTFNTLCGYGGKLFIVRSPQEGLCRWLEINGKSYSQRNGLLSPPSFINGGDGQHEHPTQELLDDFTFLEQMNWNRDKIHIALIGDLFHGRTIHSKVDGLLFFNDVTVDLIAPTELSLPSPYLKRMIKNGFKVRLFSSIDEYLQSKSTAVIWYFTRPQLERMGEDILSQAPRLRDKITVKREHLQRIPEGTRFYHPLPRHKEQPTIPPFLDSTTFNGWEEQSKNGMLVRIILLALLSGKLGDNSKSPLIEEEKKPESPLLYEKIVLDKKGKKRVISEGVNPVKRGIVIDHICRGDHEKDIRIHMNRIISHMELYGRGGEWISCCGDQISLSKGIIFRPDRGELNESEIKRLAAIAPGSTLNVIEDSQVVRKLRLLAPMRIYGLSDLTCKNKNCISHNQHGENIDADFIRTEEGEYRCRFCEQPHNQKEIWK